MTSDNFNTPILFLIFNRPDTTKVVFDSIKRMKPRYLFLAADGPRQNIDSDRENCKLARDLVLDNIDWDCEIKTLIRADNLGCGLSVSQAISWFFDQVEMGIILEDDCLPGKIFFQFMEEMLKKYKDDSSIMHIHGTHYLKNSNCDYFITKHPFEWGWATWARAWRYYDFFLHGDSREEIKSVLFRNLFNADQMAIFLEKLESLKEDVNFTWDYQWIYSIWRNNGLAISPGQNYVSNIGFGLNATHTTELEHHLANFAIVKNEQLEFNNVKALNRDYDKLIFDYYYKPFVNTEPKKTSKIKNKVFRKIRKIAFEIIPEIRKLEPTKCLLTNSYVSNLAKVNGDFRIVNSFIDDYSYISLNSSIVNTLIGKFCSIGPNLTCGWGIYPTNGISNSPMFYSEQKQNGTSLTVKNKIDETKVITIGNDVFIGMNVTILDGISIGDGAVIGAGSVVSKDIPAYAIAVGNPIKIARYRFEDDIIQNFLKIKWWDWDINSLQEVEKQFFQVDDFIKNYFSKS